MKNEQDIQQKAEDKKTPGDKIPNQMLTELIEEYINKNLKTQHYQKDDRNYNDPQVRNVPKTPKKFQTCKPTKRHQQRHRKDYSEE